MTPPTGERRAHGKAVPRPAAVADAIVVAAGASERMGGRDKLAAVVAGRPVVAWAVQAFIAAPSVERIVVVAAPERVPDLREASWATKRLAAVVAGGRRRQESVGAGFAELERLGLDDDRVVLVHDGARPAISVELIERVVAAAARHGAAIPVIPVAETVKRVAGERVIETVERAELALAQTPQGIRASVLREAFGRFDPGSKATFTDEAALLEACRIPVHAVPGDPSNRKVTVPADLAAVETALAAGLPVRVGHGRDRHPFGPGEPLMLGGLEFPGAPRLHGHSDGDVALHAVADALLGAAGLGDLGRLFPADARTPQGVASGELLAEVVRRLRVAGLRASSIDLTISAARPRLAGRLDEMGRWIGQALGVDAERVGVKASSGNLDGMEGAGRGISAEAVAVVEPIR